MTQINLGEILKKHLADYNDNGDAIPFIIEAMKEACDECLNMAASMAGNHYDGLGQKFTAVPIDVLGEIKQLIR